MGTFSGYHSRNDVVMDRRAIGDATMTTDEMMVALLRQCQTAAKTIEELEEKINEATTIEDVGIDDVFTHRDLPGIIRMLRDLPANVHNDPCRMHELDRLMTVLLQVDEAVR